MCICLCIKKRENVYFCVLESRCVSCMYVSISVCFCEFVLTVYNCACRSLGEGAWLYMLEIMSVCV